MGSTLIICPLYPLPDNSGSNMRTMHFVRYFSKLGSVDIAYAERGGGVTGVRDGFRTIIRMERDTDVTTRRRLIEGVVSGKPFPIFRYTASSHRAILDRIASCRYDHIFVRYLHCTGPLWQLPDGFRQRVILDFDDLVSGSLYDMKLGAQTGSLKRAVLSLNRRLVRRYERKCLEFGATLVCSEADRNNLTYANRRPPFVIPNVYHEIDRFASAAGDGFANDHNLLFVGSLGYGPNVAGLRWFLQNVFPGFRRAYTGATLSVVGRNPTPEVCVLCESRAGVNLFADVLDLEPYYRHARAVVVPLLSGGGTRIKILEAAAAGRPVISTPIGADGLDFGDGKEILIFQGASDFLAAYEHLAAWATYESLVDGARQVVRTKYSSDAFDRALDDMLSDLQARVRRAVG